MKVERKLKLVKSEIFVLNRLVHSKQFEYMPIKVRLWYIIELQDLIEKKNKMLGKNS